MSSVPLRRTVVVLAVTLPVLVAMAWLAGSDRPDLRFTPGVPTDVRALSRRVAADVAAALPARSDCLGGVIVDADRSLSDRARYHPASSRVVLRIPATAAQLEQALIHELAHHVEHACASHVELRSAFLAAQGLPAGTAWFTAERWDVTPSEQYAEAMVLYVRGRRSFHREVHIDAAAVVALREWAGCGDAAVPACAVPLAP